MRRARQRMFEACRCHDICAMLDTLTMMPCRARAARHAVDFRCCYAMRYATYKMILISPRASPCLRHDGAVTLPLPLMMLFQLLPPLHLRARYAAATDCFAQDARLRHARFIDAAYIRFMLPMLFAAAYATLHDDATPRCLLPPRVAITPAADAAAFAAAAPCRAFTTVAATAAACH